MDERVGPPYGIPFDFAHPGEQGVENRPPQMLCWFLTGAPYEPCSAANPSANLYAGAISFERGQVRALDYAPDAGWLRVR